MSTESCQRIILGTDFAMFQRKIENLSEKAILRWLFNSYPCLSFLGLLMIRMKSSLHLSLRTFS